MRTPKWSAAIELSGDETDEELKAIAWDIFCALHPAEAHALDPYAFWEYFHAREPDITHEQMLELLRNHSTQIH